MNLRDAYLACLPPAAYDRAGIRMGQEAQASMTLAEDAQQSARALLAEHQPDQTALALTDWERNYGLPDACVPVADQTIAQRVEDLLSRIRGKGNLSRAYMISVAQALGYPGCTITEFSGTTCVDPCDYSANGEEITGLWRLNVPVAIEINTLTCTGSCDQPLRSWGNAQLECSINRRKPAHTRVLFAYAP